MSALEDHVWGLSDVEDRVWAHLVGLRSEDVERRLLMVWQAFVDESEGNGIFSLAGYLAPAGDWVSFTKEWKNMLPFGTLGPNGRHFKMQEMAMLPERMERVPAFYRIIEKYDLIGFSLSIRLQDFTNARRRLVALGPDMTLKGFSRYDLDSPYSLAFYQLTHSLVGFVLNPLARQFDIPEDAKIDFIFDTRSEKRKIMQAWDAVVENMGERRRHLGTDPRFEKDDEFLPLQAADLFAWWVRKWEREALNPHSFPWEHSGKSSHRYIHIGMNEDALLKNMMMDAAARHPDHKTFDARVWEKMYASFTSRWPPS